MKGDVNEAPFARMSARSVEQQGSMIEPVALLPRICCLARALIRSLNFAEEGVWKEGISDEALSPARYCWSLLFSSPASSPW